VPAPTAEPVPRIAEPAPAPPEPIAPAPLPEAPPAPSTTPKATESKATDLVRTVKRTAAKVEQKMAQKQRMEEANAADKARKEAAAAKKIMTKEQYDKLYGKQANPAGKAGATKIARVDAEGIAGGVPAVPLPTRSAALAAKPCRERRPVSWRAIFRS